jgi:hypothetical protein
MISCSDQQLATLLEEHKRTRERKPPTLAGIPSFCLVMTHGMRTAKKLSLEMHFSTKPKLSRARGKPPKPRRMPWAFVGQHLERENSSHENPETLRNGSRPPLLMKVQLQPVEDDEQHRRPPITYLNGCSIVPSSPPTALIG